jgi:hypothetical protein
MSIENVDFTEVVKFYSEAREIYSAAGDYEKARECDLAIGRAQSILLDPRIIPLRAA